MADFIKGKAVEGFPFLLVHKTLLTPVTSGVVTGYFKKGKAGVQELLSNPVTHVANGEWCVNLSAAEMNADIIGLLFTHADSVSQHFTIRTTLEPAAIVVGQTTAAGPSVVDTYSFYGTLLRAEEYFLRRLGTGAWDEALVADRESALVMAARAIDKLNFAGNVATSGQSLQFPRGDDSVVPIEIDQAGYEIALAFLDDYDLEQEAQTVGILTESYSGVRTTYDANHVDEHTVAGIPSIEAWRLLKPFLRDALVLRLSRVS